MKECEPVCKVTLNLVILYSKKVQKTWTTSKALHYGGKYMLHHNIFVRQFIIKRTIKLGELFKENEHSKSCAEVLS